MRNPLRSWWTNWLFSDSRFLRRATPGKFRRWWWRRTHEVCCLFDRSLYAFLAARLTVYMECNGGYPWEYSAEEWERDIERARDAFRGAALTEALDFEDSMRDEVDWAMRWIARWHRGIWV